MEEIIYFDADGKEVGREPASNAKRFSMKAAADHRKMDAYKRAHPTVETAKLRSLVFYYRDGESRMVSGH